MAPHQVTTPSRPQARWKNREQMWRAVARAFFEAAGEPLSQRPVMPLREAVRGEIPISPEIAQMLIRLARRGAGGTAPGYFPPTLDVDRDFLQRGASETFPVRGRIDLADQARSDEERELFARFARFQREYGGERSGDLMLPFFLQELTRSPGPEPVAARSAVRRRRAEPVGPPPDPGQAADAAAFMQQVRALRSWSGLTYRDLEAQAAAKGTSLPRSTLADALNRATVLNGPLLNALTLACGLGRAQCAAWEQARIRISEQAPVLSDTVPAAPVGKRAVRVRATKSKQPGKVLRVRKKTTL